MLGAALLTTVVSATALLLAPAPADPRRMARFISVLDVVVITSVVAATGGPRSIFAFLYVLSVVAACVLLSRAGGLVVAGLGSALYVGLVFGRTVVSLVADLEPPAETTALEVVTMFLNTATFLVIAVVAGGLAARFRETSVQLESQRRDLRDLRAYHDVIFQSVPTGLIALDEDHRITAFNRAAEEITGIPAGAAVGRSARVVFGDVLPLGVIAAGLGPHGEVSARHEATVTRADGTAVPVRLTLSALMSADADRLGLIAVCEDLSRMREMEVRMRQADRLATLGRMAANIAHEIRNPLASLSGAIEALAGGSILDDERQRLSQIVLRESDRLNGIICDFLEYARPAPLTLALVDVAEVLDELLVLLEHAPLPPGVKVVREFPPELRWPLDAQQIRQAFWNLCLNGIEAMPDGGELQVGAAADATRLRVWVTDTGEGIPPAELAHVVEPFFSTKPGGSGFGLALVHRIVSEHGGQLDVRSTPGVGTTITLTLPRRADG
jgi:two-component system sensor histidine kinase PilS (NtrC family)